MSSGALDFPARDPDLDLAWLRPAVAVVLVPLPRLPLRDPERARLAAASLRPACALALLAFFFGILATVPLWAFRLAALRLRDLDAQLRRDVERALRFFPAMLRPPSHCLSQASAHRPLDWLDAVDVPTQPFEA